MQDATQIQSYSPSFQYPTVPLVSQATPGANIDKPGSQEHKRLVNPDSSMSASDSRLPV
jgi:hypothetical protein